MSIAEKLLTIAENEQRVYDAGYEKGKAEGGGGDTDAAFEAGRQAEINALWDKVTGNGTRTDFTRAFFGCDYSGVEFSKPVAPTGAVNQCFDNYQGTELPKNLDFSNCTFPNNQVTNLCCKARNLTVFYDIKLPAPTALYFYTFDSCNKLEKIEILRCVETARFERCFNYCYELKDITVDGTIGQNGFNVQWSTKLSQDSLISILEACNADVTASPITITLPKKCIDGATDTETILNNLGGDFENTVYIYGASTIQLPHINIKPNSVSLIPVDENGNQTNADWIDDGNGNIINPYYPEDQQFVGTINYATGLIDISSGYGTFGELYKYIKCQYTVDSAYNMALSKGYNIAFV